MSDVWQVKMASGEVRSLDVDQLDAAFQAGWVSPSTPVLKQGGEAWTTLAEAAGLDDVQAAPSSIAPIALDAARAEIEVEIESSSLSSETYVIQRPRRWPWVVGIAALFAFIPAAGLGGMKIAQKTLGAPPPPPPAAVVVAPSPSPVRATTVDTTSTPTGATVFGVSVADLPNAKKVSPAAFKRRRK